MIEIASQRGDERARHDDYLAAIAAVTAEADGTVLAICDILEPGTRDLLPYLGYAGGAATLLTFPSRAAWLAAILSDAWQSGLAARRAAVRDAIVLAAGENGIPPLARAMLGTPRPATDFLTPHIDGTTPAEIAAALLAVYPDSGADPTRVQLETMVAFPGFRDRPVHAFVYVANWGTRQLMLRLPRVNLDPLAAEPYTVEYSLGVHVRDDRVILAFDAEDEERDDIEWITDEEAENWLPALLPLRAELAAGDQRALYLGWLSAIEMMEEDEEVEPPVAPGLRALSPTLQTLATFLRVDQDLLAVAATASPDLPAPPSPADLQQWIAVLPPAKKDALLLQPAHDANGAQTALMRRFRQEATPLADAPPGERTVAQLLEAAEAHRAERERQEAEREALARAKRERKATAARAAYLDTLIGEEEALWRQVATLIATTKPKEYDRPVQLLADLRDLAARGNTNREFTARLAALREGYAKRRGLIDRLDKAGLRA